MNRVWQLLVRSKETREIWTHHEFFWHEHQAERAAEFINAHPEAGVEVVSITTRKVGS